MFTIRFMGRGALVSTMLCLALSPAFARDSVIAPVNDPITEPTLTT